MKQRFFNKQAALLAATLLAGGCALAAPNSSSSTASKEPQQMTSETPAAQQTLPEILGDPNDWEMHIYTYPLHIDTVRPVWPGDLLERGRHVHYQRITDLATVSSTIDAFEGILPSKPPVTLFGDSRVLIEFRHKASTRIISLANDGYLMSFHLRRDGEYWGEELSEIVLRDESRYRIVERLYRESLRGVLERLEENRLK